MKVGTISFHSSNNFGCVLQSFALSETIRELFLDACVEEINFRRTLLQYDNRPYRIQYEDKCKQEGTSPTEEGYAEFEKLQLGMQKRIDRFRDFRNQYMNMGEVIYDMQEVDNDKYDVCISGSDQVWNWGLTHGYEDAYFLEFSDDKTRRIAYAASLGIDLFNEPGQVEWLKQHIKSFDYISIREKSYLPYIQKITDKSMPVCLDPTLLHSQSFWGKFEKKPEGLGDEKYVLMYALGYRWCKECEEKAAQMANDVAKKNGYKIIHYYYGELKNWFPKDSEHFYFEGPQEFLWLVHHAEYVICCSFHATAFSVIYHKPFYTFHVPGNGARMKDLVDTIGIPDRYIDSVLTEDEWNFDIDWDKCEEKLEEQRRISLDYLRKAIS
ncbi:MAG: polysaccharide pyruvyl transferase family protein [Lachnospiraceae bacterium]|nr:polysaccharide pyruvyl transferase family protein [Lachnospiraceae bacterium]